MKRWAMRRDKGDSAWTKAVRAAGCAAILERCRNSPGPCFCGVHRTEVGDATEEVEWPDDGSSAAGEIN